ncbi:MAG: hypothetical protein HQ542_14065 [Bacteroidia bacterium]|nr:hypothetical protein [Bacteroidia bacterium]
MKTHVHMKLILSGMILFLIIPIFSIAQTSWVKYEDNPVLQPFGTWAATDVSAPCVIYEEGVYKMWFSGSTDLISGSQIGYATSSDGITWNPNDDPVILSGAPGAWDEEKNHPNVLHVNDTTYLMWFSGSSDGFNWEISIGYATSPDGIAWTVLPDPVLEKGDPGSWEENAVYKPAVYFDGINYMMWYNGYEGTEITDPDRVGYATSTDGINWIKDTAHNPVMNLEDPDTFFDTWVQSNCVLFMEGEYRMWFEGWDNTSITPLRYKRI